MKFLCVIRFDQSDDKVFERAAAAGEWAVPGAFEFVGITERELTGKMRQAFANGFLALPSFGRSTFVTIGQIADNDIERLAQLLADNFMLRFGAPGYGEAIAAAREEIDFVLEMCAPKPVNTCFTVRRILTEAGDFREEYREISPPGLEKPHTRIWDMIDDGT